MDEHLSGREGSGSGRAQDGQAQQPSQTRRDLLQGLALAAAAPGLLGAARADAAAAGAADPVGADASASPMAGAPVDAAGQASGYAFDAAYPPARTGLRGTHPGAFEAAHALRDGQPLPPVQDSGEQYDLVVVGAGISGLSAAFFYRQHHPQARVLILDPHDDFGGHAKRNEFVLDGQLHVMNGGTYSIESPRPYSPVADGLLKAVGIDAGRLQKRVPDKKFYASYGLQDGIYFDSAHFGRDALVRRKPGQSWERILAHAPLSAQARKDIARLEEQKIDYLPGLSSDQKKERLSRISYRDFLLDIAKVDPDVVRFYQQRTHGWYCLGIEAVVAIDCWAFGFPGMQGLGLKPGSIRRMGPTAAGFADTGGSVDVHPPDGGATVARSLVRALVPDAIPGQSVEDLETARVDYARLDLPDHPVRVRLSSTAVRVHNLAAGDSSGGVRVDYVQGGRAYGVAARQCVLACWSAVIPHICPELPEEQKAAMHMLVKSPLVYASVALRNWKAFERLGVARIYAPQAYFSSVFLNEALRIGKYHTPGHPDHPVLVHMVHTPVSEGKSAADQYRIGRAELLATSLETYEERIRTQLDAMLAPGGFDSARDIVAITVNRWPHGYAYEFDPLSEPVAEPGQAPFEIARRRFGAITIANSDVGGLAYMDSAIDQAHRAVNELLES